MNSKFANFIIGGNKKIQRFLEGMTRGVVHPNHSQPVGYIVVISNQEQISN